MINIAILNIGSSGVSKFRIIDPHVCLQNNHTDSFFVDILPVDALVDENKFKNYQMVFIHNVITQNDKLIIQVDKLKKMGIKIIVDVDDYWELSASHKMFKHTVNGGTTVKTINLLKNADLVTTTTKALATYIKKFNKNVVVIPNSINPIENQFTPNKVESENTRIGWCGGSSHLEDLQLLNGVADSLSRNTVNTQMVLCGWNDMSKDIKTGETVIAPLHSVWLQYERIFTNDFKTTSKKYTEWLLSFNKTETYKDVCDEKYVRIWTQPVNKYASCYNQIDISLAPLKDNTFNQLKSQLKIIEAGFHKKPIIVSEITPYLIDCVHNKNAVIIPDNKKHKMWIKSIVELSKNKEMQRDLGESLYETVKETYNLNNTTKKRAEAYKSLL